MHPSLSRELRGTPKIYRSIRTRSSSRCPSQTRTFSSRPYLLNQSPPKDSGASSANANTSESYRLYDPSTALDHFPQVFVDAFEKYLDYLSEKTPGVQLWDAISQKDEHGNHKVLPHVRADLLKKALEAEASNIKEKEEKAAAAAARDTERKDPRQSTAEPSQTSRSNTIHIQHLDSPAGQATTNDDLSQEVGKDLSSKFHGSTAARRQRERQSRIRDRPQIIALPNWFNVRNVKLESLHTEGRKSRGSVESSASVSEIYGAKTGEPVSSDAGGIEILEQPSQSNSQEDTNVEKKQTHNSAPTGEEPEDSNSPPTIPEVELENSQPALVALKNANRRYYIQAAQRTELVLTVQGRLKLPDTSSSNGSTGIRSHLLVHYTAKDGDVFLDRLVEDIAGQLRCNVVALDAQDIAALISSSDMGTLVTNEAKAMSYEIYGDIYRDKAYEDDDDASLADDLDDMDEDNMSSTPQGIPFMVGKPITIDLKAIFGSANGTNRPSFRNASQRNLANATMIDMGELNRGVGGRSMQSSPVAIFQPLVDSILSSTKSKSDAMEDRAAESSTQLQSPQNESSSSTIFHIKDLKAIQETNIGRSFLQAVYETVNRRRNNGESIMLIGTSCDRRGRIYDTERINTMQVSELEEISSTVVITPAYSNASTELNTEDEVRNEIQRSHIPQEDRAARLSMINARHIFEMLQSKNVSLGTLKNGFWSRNLADCFAESDRDHLSRTFWNFSYVQRLAAVLASSNSAAGSPHSISEAVEILTKSDMLKYQWAKQTPPGRSRRAKKDDEEAEDPMQSKLAQIRSKATKHEKKLLGGVIEAKKINTTFRDIHIPTETVDALQTLTTLSLVRPDAFKYGVLASDRIPGLLLYGPPGTGKTLAAKAVAKESGATMLEVSAADINDMYVGEGEKNVKALFSLAKKLSPCVVFLDEADAMFSARSNAGRRVSHRELLNQFLREWDGMSNDSGSAFIMVATNRPMDLDDAVLRRLPRRLLVDLPTEKDRLEILKIHLRHEKLADDVDLAKLASRTPFYSGSDLKNVAVAAALNCVREENQLAKDHAANAATATTASDGSTPVQSYQHASKRTLTAKHFDSALEEISASISEDMTSLRDIKKFDEQYGDRKGRKRKSPKWGFKTAREADKVLDTVKVRS